MESISVLSRSSRRQANTPYLFFLTFFSAFFGLFSSNFHRSLSRVVGHKVLVQYATYASEPIMQNIMPLSRFELVYLGLQVAIASSHRYSRPLAQYVYSISWLPFDTNIHHRKLPNLARVLSSMPGFWTNWRPNVSVVSLSISLSGSSKHQGESPSHRRFWNRLLTS